MDTKALIREAHARFEHNSAKKILKEKYQAKLTIANQGGLWKASPELIQFMDGIESVELILEDIYENPIKVNRQQLLDILRETHTRVMEEWYTDFQELKHKR